MPIRGGTVAGLGRGLYAWLPPERLVVTAGSEYRHLDGSELPGILQVMAVLTAVAHESGAVCTGGRA